jgi:hypothetical protein
MLLEMMRNPRFKPGTNPRPIAISVQKQELWLEFDAA